MLWNLVSLAQVLRGYKSRRCTLTISRDCPFGWTRHLDSDWMFKSDENGNWDITSITGDPVNVYLSYAWVNAIQQLDCPLVSLNITRVVDFSRDWNFVHFGRLETVTFDDTLISIGNNAFDGCTMIKNFTLSKRLSLCL